jgi:hypothetical protein
LDVVTSADANFASSAWEGGAVIENLFRPIAPVLVLVVFAGCAYKSQLVYQPSPIPVLGQKDAATIGKAIRRALVNRDWAITRD